MPTFGWASCFLAHRGGLTLSPSLLLWLCHKKGDSDGLGRVVWHLPVVDGSDACSVERIERRVYERIG
jgi:hypothetical protein